MFNQYFLYNSSCSSALQFINKYVGHYNSYFSQSLMGDDVNSISSKGSYLSLDCYDYGDTGDPVTDPWWRYWMSIKAANFIINGGGVINAGQEAFTTYDKEKVLEQVHNIYNTVYNILEESKATGEPEGVIAQRFAENRIKNGL